MHTLRAEPVDFYMVWTKTGWAPKKAHHTRAAAFAEANRLAARHPGKKFIVLRTLAKIVAEEDAQAVAA